MELNGHTPNAAAVARMAAVLGKQMHEIMPGEADTSDETREKALA